MSVYHVKFVIFYEKISVSRDRYFFCGILNTVGRLKDFNN